MNVTANLTKIKAGVAFAGSYFNFRYRNRPRPLSAVFVVCNRCNLTCRYCNSPFLKDRELSLGDIDRLLVNLKRMGTFRLGLTGGEPLLRDDLGAIIGKSRNLGFYTSLNSNLLLYQDRPEIFDHVNFVFTSLDGTPEIHEKNRGPGSGTGVLKAIADLRRRGKPLVAITVVDETNAEKIPELIAYARDLDFKLHFQVKVISTVNTDTDIVRGNFSSTFLNDNYREIWKKILDLKRSTKVIASSERYLESIVAWPDYRQIRTKLPVSKCAAGFGYIYIDSEGIAYPCCLIKKAIPGVNLLSEDWIQSYKGGKPCNSCICGPYLQLNLLYTEPWKSITDLYSAYGTS